jgi:membrane protease YdiL (CAAX protease family)
VTLASYKATQAMPAPPLVGGRRLLTTVLAGAGAAAVTGAITWFALHGLMQSANAALITQLVIAIVYATLLASFAVSFRPLQNPPLDLRFTSAKDLRLACLALLGVVCSALLVYLFLSPLTGGIAAAARQTLSLVTDAVRLKGQPPSAWVVAIVRGCLIVPLFEEIFFRSLLFGWLRTRLSTRSAIGVSAALFAAMHGYPIVMPYVFLFGLFTGWIRARMGSIFDTVVMHVLNNVLFLCAGLYLLR